MGLIERSKKKILSREKAIIHFLLCFVMGFFTGFTPTGKNSNFPIHITMWGPSPLPLVIFHEAKPQNATRNLLDETEGQNRKENITIVTIEEQISRRLLIVVTPTNDENGLREILLRRLANTLRLVAQPLLWIVLEKKSDDYEVSEILRRSGIMYRHVVFKENFTDVNSEMDHQRNLALNHIEHHRLSGIVHFAGLSNVYDLDFFEEIREIEGFGAWPIAKLSGNNSKMVIEGPVCDSSEVMGWHLNKMNNLTDERPPPMHISSFAFNSSILWDPERWGRTSAVQDTSQDSLKYVRNEVLEEETKLKGIPSEGCSKVLLWDLHISMRH